MAKRKSTVEQLGAGAVVAYRRAGWRFTEHGHVDAGVTSGPCARCRESTRVYGPGGNPLCEGCRGAGA